MSIYVTLVFVSAVLPIPKKPTNFFLKKTRINFKARTLIPEFYFLGLHFSVKLVKQCLAEKERCFAKQKKRFFLANIPGAAKKGKCLSEQKKRFSFTAKPFIPKEETI